MSNLNLHITATGNTKVYGNKAILEKVVINTANAGAVTIYDYATATGPTGSVAVITPTTIPVGLDYSMDMKNGIIINNATGGQDISVCYKPA